MLDARTLEALYRSHAPMVLRRARSLLGDAAAAQDAVHEVFASLLARPEQFHGKSAPSTFLYAVTTNLCLKRLRDHANRARLVALHVVPRMASSAQAPGEDLAVLRDILARVPEELAQVATYYFMDEMSHDEIAEVLGCSRRHVGNLLQRFRERAARIVQGDAA
jgi:RNA polymerase sigma factor (sigma-70 family)